MYYQPQHALYFRVTCADKLSSPSSFVLCLLEVPSDKTYLCHADIISDSQQYLLQNTFEVPNFHCF